MDRLTGGQIRERAKQLKPARQFAFNMVKQNPQMTFTELAMALKEKGFEVNKNTTTAYLMRYKKLLRIGPIGKKYKTQKSTPARLLAFKLWEENPRIKGSVLQQLLKEKGLEASRSICYYWLKKFKNGKGVDTHEEKPVTAEEPSEITSKLSLEQIIEAAGSVETLSMLFYQGVMRELGKKDAVYHLLKQECIEKDNTLSSLKNQLDVVTRERNKIMREWNEKLSKVKVGTLTLDESTKRLVPKL